MKKILLVHLPFCTPATPSYSLTAMQSFLQSNTPKETDIEVIDLNLKFHILKFPKFHKYSKNQKLWKTYSKITEEYIKTSKKIDCFLQYKNKMFRSI